MHFTRVVQSNYLLAFNVKLVLCVSQQRQQKSQLSLIVASPYLRITHWVSSKQKGNLVKGMEPWEGLDIDDSELETFVRRCNSTTNLISGPAGNVQAILLNQNSSKPKNTQDFVKCIAKASHHQDFSTNPWEWVQKFIDFHCKFF